MQKAKLLSAAVMAGLFMAGCNGGGGDSPAPVAGAASAEGLWPGTTNTNRAITGIVLDDGIFYVLYSQVNNPAVIAGVVQGNGTSLNGSFSSANARDFNMEGQGVLPATVSASYISRQSLNGSVTYAVGATTFTSNYSADYDVTPSLATLAGTFSGQVISSQGVENANVTVNAAGGITGTGVSGCSVTGTATPRTKGNVFNLSLTFGGAPCLFANQTMAGIAYFDSVAKRLYGATPNAARTDGVLFVGVKP
jgi:hypothetical protein